MVVVVWEDDALPSPPAKEKNVSVCEQRKQCNFILLLAALACEQKGAPFVNKRKLYWGF